MAVLYPFFNCSNLQYSFPFHFPQSSDYCWKPETFRKKFHPPITPTNLLKCLPAYTPRCISCRTSPLHIISLSNDIKCILFIFMSTHKYFPISYLKTKSPQVSLIFQLCLISVFLFVVKILEELCIASASILPFFWKPINISLFCWSTPPLLKQQQRILLPL